MLNAHFLSWAEITTLIAAFGLVMNASVGFYMTKKSDARRNLQALRIPAKRNSINPRYYD